MLSRARFFVGCLPVLSLACADTPEAAGPSLDVDIAALTLPGVGTACYDLRVWNATDTVWSKGNPALTRLGADQTGGVATGAPDIDTVCSDDYGNGPGGDITYIGTCDATSGPTSDTDPLRAGVQNEVTLWVDGLYDLAITADIGDWQDPCPLGCTLSVDCNENEDSLVRFDITIMRDAFQGFFDIAVNFEDIFCSAKLDTCYDGDEAIELLFRADGMRGPTAVLGIACTAGAEDDVETILYMDTVEIECPDGEEGWFTVASLDPSVGTGGNAYDLSPGGAGDPVADDGVFQYAVYEGLEDLECGEESCHKAYWNIAIGLEPDELDDGCRIVTRATAANGLLTGGYTPEATTYPFIAVSAPVIDDGVACTRNPLNDGDLGVTTTYTHVSRPQHFCYVFDGDVSEVVPAEDDSWPSGLLGDLSPLERSETLLFAPFGAVPGAGPCGLPLTTTQVILQGDGEMSFGVHVSVGAVVTSQGELEGVYDGNTLVGGSLFDFVTANEGALIDTNLVLVGLLNVVGTNANGQHQESSNMAVNQNGLYGMLTNLNSFSQVSLSVSGFATVTGYEGFLVIAAEGEEDDIEPFVLALDAVIFEESFDP